ncbi:hypothetical protein BOX15_Mlig033033g2, partial [Macrostomum lignano]
SGPRNSAAASSEAGSRMQQPSPAAAPLRLHRVCGAGLSITDDRLSARRRDSCECEAVAFSAEPLQLNQWASFELQQQQQKQRREKRRELEDASAGGLRVGVTTLNPQSLQGRLPRYSYPPADWPDEDAVWVQPVPEGELHSGGRLTLHLNTSGQLHYFVDGEHRGSLLSYLPMRQAAQRPFWLLLDVYGSTRQVTSVPTNETPMEIISRGLGALEAYHRACESGTKPTYRTRLMLLGPPGAGKSSLKRALLGAFGGPDSALKPDSCIDLSSSCVFDAESSTGQAWQAVRATAAAAAAAGDLRSGSATQLMDLESVESLGDPSRRVAAAGLDSGGELDGEQAFLDDDEVNSAVAENIVQMLSSSAGGSGGGAGGSYKVNLTAASSVADLADLDSSVGGSSHLSVSGGVGDLTSRMVRPRLASSASSHMILPDSVASLVDSALQQQQQQTPLSQPRRRVRLNIWDFNGHSLYHTMHQMFLTHRAVYVFVFDLRCELDGQTEVPFVQRQDDMDETNCSRSSGHVGGSSFSLLDYMDYWFSLVHMQQQQQQQQQQPLEADRQTEPPASPPIFLVGTHRNELGGTAVEIEATVARIFLRIKEVLQYKPYFANIVDSFYALDLAEAGSGPSEEQMASFRRHCESVIRFQPYMGEVVPLKWLKLEQQIAQLVRKKNNIISLDRLSCIGQEEGLSTLDELLPALNFFHDLGLIVYCGNRAATEPSVLTNTVILSPRWLLDLFSCVIAAKPVEENVTPKISEAYQRLIGSAILNECLLDRYWARHSHQKPLLIGLMEKFDLLALRVENSADSAMRGTTERSFYVPSLLRHRSTLNSPNCSSSVVFYMRFHHFLPDGLFQRLICRFIRWSQELGGRNPVLFSNAAWFFLDQEHDCSFELSAYRLAWIKVSVYRVTSSDLISEHPPTSCLSSEPPDVAVVAKLRKFLESTLEEIRQIWLKRVTFSLSVACPCGVACKRHSQEACQQQECLHFLSLDECLSSKLVCCGHRRLKTARWRRWFPNPQQSGGRGGRHPPPLIPYHVLSADIWNIEVQKGHCLPQWMKSAAKLLNGAPPGQDWQALAERLGYSSGDVHRFNEDLNPALILLADWVISAGNSDSAVDMAKACLVELGRCDIADAIDAEREDEGRLDAQVFISYQWDSQESVRLLRDLLERQGFACWMDVGQLGGGDLLNARIDKALRGCRCVLACVTPKFACSQACVRELCLADLLRKPIIPVMLERTVWPPPGSLSLVLSPYVYIDMNGVGGHGGSGRQADTQARYFEILAQVGKYAEPRLVSASQHSISTKNSLDHLTPTRGGGQHDLTPGSAAAAAAAAAAAVAAAAAAAAAAGRDNVSYTSDLSSAGNRTPTPGGAGGGGGAGGAPRSGAVSVRKCAVCSIL